MLGEVLIEKVLIEKARTYANTPGRLRARSGSKLPAASVRSGPYIERVLRKGFPSLRVQTVICGCFADWGAEQLDFSLKFSEQKLRKSMKN